MLYKHWWLVSVILSKLKYGSMKTSNNLRTLLMAILAILVISCSSQGKIKGTASDKSGTNGATNGTGKVKGL